MVASPRPTIPSSVWILTRTKSDVACSPWAVLADRPFLSGTATGIGSMRVIFMGVSCLPSPSPLRRGGPGGRGLGQAAQRPLPPNPPPRSGEGGTEPLFAQEPLQHVRRDPRHMPID